MIEKWKDTAFGSDFGGDFLVFIENNFDEKLSITEIYSKTDIEQYLINPTSLAGKTDNNVLLQNVDGEQYIHFEDFIIALSAIIVEYEIHGIVDLTKAYGNKNFIFKLEKSELEPIYISLKNIYEKPENYVLFDMMLEEERNGTIRDIKDILNQFKKLL